jgi:hypothetical protein
MPSKSLLTIEFRYCEACDWQCQLLGPDFFSLGSLGMQNQPPTGQRRSSVDQVYSWFLASVHLTSVKCKARSKDTFTKKLRRTGESSGRCALNEYGRGV